MAWTKKGHSPSSHPRHRITVRSSQRSVLLTRTFCYCIVQENTFSFGQNFALFSSNFGTPESTFRATRTVRAEYEFGARDSYRNRYRNSATPSSQIGGEAPDVYIFHLRDISQGQPPRPKRFNNRTGGPGSSQLSTLSGKPRSIFPTFKNHLWQRN